MFLDKLKDAQKELFLELAIKAADSSCGISKEERMMLEAFAKEMNIPVKYECEKTVKQITDALIKISNKKELRIIIFEIIGIMYSDSNYDETERKFVKDLQEMFSLDTELVKKMESTILQYTKLYIDIYDLVINGPAILCN